MVQKTDAVLVAETLAGRSGSFATLVTRHRGMTYGTALAMLGDPHVSEDLVQEAFLCALEDLAKLRDPNRFGAWLRGIVRYLGHSELRARERARILREDLKESGFRKGVATPDQRLEEAEQRAIVRRAMRGLVAKYRKVVELRYLRHLSYKAIAEELGLSETTVKGRLQQARSILRFELSGLDDAAADTTAAPANTKTACVAIRPPGEENEDAAAGSQWQPLRWAA